MAEREPESADASPDVRTVRQLVRLMHRFDLTAIDLTNERTTIRLRRSRGVDAAAPTAAPVAAAAAPAQAAASPPPPAPPRPTAEAVYIRSPMVGTFYESPSPDASPYVQVGSIVRPDTTVCLIEAMKVFTEINSGVSGSIAEVLVKSGQAVEFDQPLFRVEPN